mgnify:CR=1 FL=1|jgi:large subunit ribosomal protein L10
MSNLDLKKKQVERISEQFSDSEAFIISGYKGLNVEQLTELRSKVRDGGFTSTVIKNSIFSFSSKSLGLDIPKEILKGQNIFFKADKDVVGLTKILVGFSKINENLSLKGGVLEGSFISNDQVTELSKLPSKAELIAKTVGLIKGPLTGLVGTLSSPINGFINVLNNIKNNK